MIHDIEVVADRYEDILAEIELFMPEIPRCPVCGSDDTYLVDINFRSCWECGNWFDENIARREAA